MPHMLKMGSFKVLTTPFLDSEVLVALTPGAALPAVTLFFFWRSHTSQHCDFLLGLLQLVYLLCLIWPTPQISSFYRIAATITPTRTQKVLLTPVGRKYLIGSSPLTSSMTLTYLLFSIASLAVALLTFPLLPSLLLLGGASGPGF